MEVVIKQILNECFEDFQRDQLMILVVFSIIILVIQIFTTIYVAKKIQVFKNDLERSKIRFSKFNELQIVALREIYHKLVAFQVTTNLIFNSKTNTIGHSKYKSRINKWIKSYVACESIFAKEKILLTDELKELFGKTLQDFREVKTILMEEKSRLDEYEMGHLGIWNAMYEFEGEELDVISKKIGDLKTQEPIKNSGKHIRKLRTKIETEFKKMTT